MYTRTKSLTFAVQLDKKSLHREVKRNIKQIYNIIN